MHLREIKKKNAALLMKKASGLSSSGNEYKRADTRAVAQTHRHGQSQVHSCIYGLFRCPLDSPSFRVPLFLSLCPPPLFPSHRNTHSHTIRHSHTQPEAFTHLFIHFSFSLVCLQTHNPVSTHSVVHKHMRRAVGAPPEPRPPGA